MSTKTNPGKFDCYSKADPDEPMFVLLARDKHAPTLVWLWATLRELDGENKEVVQEARECCGAMLEWMVGHDRKEVGIGQAALASVLDLCRAANLNKEWTNSTVTEVETVRGYLCEILLEK